MHSLQNPKQLHAVIKIRQKKEVKRKQQHSLLTTVQAKDNCRGLELFSSGRTHIHNTASLPSQHQYHTGLLTAATTLQTLQAQASHQHVLTLKNTFSTHFAHLAILLSYKLNVM